MSPSGGDTCPACGYELWFAPWSGASPSDEICPSCGIQFGYDDAAGGQAEERPRLYEAWRARWIQAGCPWFSPGIQPPAGWEPRRQMERAGLKPPPAP